MLRDGLWLVQQREAEDEARLAALREAANVGIADFDAGRYSSFANGEALRNHLAARTAKILSQLAE